tara:strand:- start:711 stop:2285 length:1575 start_codon:yes stop_codon:yes gene_type:complete
LENFHIAMAAVTAIILFVFGLENFSREIQHISGEQFRKSLAKATRLPVVGVALGAAVTAIIQSSSATSVITIGLVNAGVLSFKNSVGIIFGSNIGTTITAQLVAFKLTTFAPVFIILGFILSLVRSRYSIFGKAVFYFGFVFFSLNLIAASLEPLQQDEALIKLLTQPQNPLYAILFGCLFTAAVQSSSVTTGLAIIFTQQGLLGLENAVPIIMGANIGTTATALLVVFNMDIAAKKTALCHFLFNVGGVLLFLPVLMIWGHKLNSLQMDPAIELAYVHLIFNVVTSLIFIIGINPFVRFVDAIMGEGKMDFKRLSLPVYDPEKSFETVKKELDDGLNNLFDFLQENYNQVILSIETNYPSVFEAAEKRIEYVNFVEKEYIRYFSQIVVTVKKEDESSELIAVIGQFDYLFQIEDSIEDLFNTKKVMLEAYIDPHADILFLIRTLSIETLGLFEDIHRGLGSSEETSIKQRSRDVQESLSKANRELLTLMADNERRDAGALINFVTYSQRLKDKLVNFHKVKTG